jgi:hypothetical protein
MTTCPGDGSSQSIDATWNQIDHELVRHKLSLISSDLQPRTFRDENRVRSELRQTGKGGGLASQLVTVHVQLTDEWIGRTYEAYCETWHMQGKQKSAAFIRAVFQGALVPLVAVRQSATLSHFAHTQGHSCAIAGGHFVRSLTKLRGAWWDKLEVEAEACKYPAKQPLFQQKNDVTHGTARRRFGRPARLDLNFVDIAGKLWLDAKQKSRNTTVDDDRLVQIASELDASGYAPPSKYLEKSCAEAVKAFNSRNSNSKSGVIKTWECLVSIGDKDHVRGMRKLLSRCAAKSGHRRV